MKESSNTLNNLKCYRLPVPTRCVQPANDCSTLRYFYILLPVGKLLVRNDGFIHFLSNYSPIKALINAHLNKQSSSKYPS